MSCYFSFEVLNEFEDGKLLGLLESAHLPFNNEISVESNSKYINAGTFLCAIGQASQQLDEFSQALKINDFPHIIWLDNSNNMLFKTYSYKWNECDHT